MIVVYCSRCDTRLEAPDSAAGKILACPECNADVSVPVPASAQVIEVRAEALNDPEPDYADDPFFNPEHQQPFSGPAWGRTIQFGRRGDGSGCCAVGCLGLVFFVYLAFRGFLSLFS